MKSEDLITSAELNALLTPEERERLEAEKALVNSEEIPEEMMDRLDQELIMELKQAVSALTLRVEALEHQLLQQEAEREREMLLTPNPIQGSPFLPKTESFSRSESYGRNHKKKKSLLRKLLD